MVRVVCAVLHKYDVAAEDDKTTFDPLQKVVAPDGVIVGVDGAAVTVTVIAEEVLLHPPDVTVTV